MIDRYATIVENHGYNEYTFKWDRIIKDAAIGLALLIFVPMFWPFAQVPTGSRGVVTQFGEIIKIEQEGLHLLPPWQKLSVFSVRAEQADIDKAVANTNDTQPVDTSLTVRYNIQPDKVAFVYEQYTHNGDLSSYVQTATMEVFKAVAARYSAPDLIGKRANVSSDIVAGLQEKLDKYGAHVINIDMRIFEFNPQYMKAINDKAFQEQQKLVADNTFLTVTSQQKARVAVAEANANVVRAKANGDADAAKAEADGASYAILKNAQAAADALKMQNAAIATSKDVLLIKQLEVQLQWAKNWQGSYPQIIGGNAPAAFMNIPYPPAPSH